MECVNVPCFSMIVTVFQFGSHFWGWSGHYNDNDGDKSANRLMFPQLHDNKLQDPTVQTHTKQMEMNQTSIQLLQKNVSHWKAGDWKRRCVGSLGITPKAGSGNNPPLSGVSRRWNWVYQWDQWTPGPSQTQKAQTVRDTRQRSHVRAHSRTASIVSSSLLYTERIFKDKISPHYQRPQVHHSKSIPVLRD